MNREELFDALLEKLKATADYRTVSRRLKHWSDVSPADQPALYLIEKRDNYARTPGLNPIYRFELDAVIYAHTGDGNDDEPAGRVLNPLLDAIDELLRPDDVMKNKCTLGGLVQHAWIEGAIEKDEGVLGPQGVALVPLVILTA